MPLFKCIYCGSSFSASKHGGEHVLQKAIGGTVRISDVCEKCNNETLSVIDKELVNKSPLSIVAGAHFKRPLEYFWEVADQGLLLEASPTADFSSCKLWPQMILRDETLDYYSDMEADRLGGYENSIHCFCRCLETAFQSNRLTLERVEPVSDGRYPPRVFARSRIGQFHQGMSFIIRYSYADERRRMMRVISKSFDKPRPPNSQIIFTHIDPKFRLNYCASDVLRAFVKIAINTLSWRFGPEFVLDSAFRRPRAFVAGRLQHSIEFLKRNGFVYAADLTPLACDSNFHRIRLVYDERSARWHAYFAFFGARIGAQVVIEGKNPKCLRTFDITIPIGSPDLVVNESPLLLPLKARVEWGSMDKVVPSFTNLEPLGSCMVAERVRKRKKSLKT
jgi:hypothetical protein